MSWRLLAASIFAVTIGCRDSQGVTAPLTNIPVMTASSPTEFSVFPGVEMSTPPVVRVTLSEHWVPIPGIRVTFAYTDGSTKSVLTDADGYARTDTWPLDSAKTSDRVVATAEGISGAIKFTALIIHKPLIAIYDLKSIGGNALPRTYSGGGTGWTVTGGHYALFSDGTYIFGYEFDGRQSWSIPQTFIDRGSQTDFYLSHETASQFYAERGYLFSTATVFSGGMSVVYTDFVDFEDEVYKKR